MFVSLFIKSKFLLYTSTPSILTTFTVIDLEDFKLTENIKSPFEGFGYKLLIEIVSYVLNKGHYSPSQINDQFSEEVYKNFLEGVDSRHLFFIQSDIDFFDSFKFIIDDQIKASKIEFFDLSHQRYLQRLDQVKSFYSSLLNISFDLLLSLLAK